MCKNRVKATLVLTSSDTRCQVGGYFCVRGGLCQQQKQQCAAGQTEARPFPSQGATWGRASSGQQGPAGARAPTGGASSGSCLKGRGKEAGGHPAHSLDPLRCKWPPSLKLCHTFPTCVFYRCTLFICSHNSTSTLHPIIQLRIWLQIQGRGFKV